MKYSNEQLDEMFNKLPEVVQDYLMSYDVKETMSKLSEEKAILNKDLFKNALFGLLVGAYSLDEFIQVLEGNGGISDEEIDHIVVEVNDNILETIDFILKYKVKNSNSFASRSIKAQTQPQRDMQVFPPSREQVLDDIEHPVPLIIKNPGGNVPSIIDSKLNAKTTLPQEKVQKYLGSDPYREAPDA